LDLGNSRLIAFRAEGRLTTADYDVLEERMRQVLLHADKARFYVEIAQDFKGLHWRTLLRELSFDVRYAGKIQDCAVVGRKKSHKLLTRLSRPFFEWMAGEEVRYYDYGERKEAMLSVGAKVLPASLDV